MAKKKVRKATRLTRSKPVRKAAAKKSVAKTVRAKVDDGKTLRLSSVTPGLTVNDVHKSMAWYCDVLGCTIKDRWEQDGVLRGGELAAGDIQFMIGQDDWKQGRDRVKGAGFRIYCATTQDVDRLAGQIKARGGTLSYEPRDEWGMRSFGIEDPDGFKITIAKALKR